MDPLKHKENKINDQTLSIKIEKISNHIEKLNILMNDYEKKINEMNEKQIEINNKKKEINLKNLFRKKLEQECEYLDKLINSFIIRKNTIIEKINKINTFLDEEELNTKLSSLNEIAKKKTEITDKISKLEVSINLKIKDIHKINKGYKELSVKNNNQ